VNVELTSAFIVNACQLLPKSSSTVTDHMQNMVKSACPSQGVYGISSGSSAEFYIRPLNTCIGDHDDIFARSHEIAFIDDVPVLPRDISGLDATLICCKIESDKRYPGFLRLRGLGEMKYNWKRKIYECKCSAHTNRYKVSYMTSMQCSCPRPPVVSGPAIKHRPMPASSSFGHDDVETVWCPEWPKEANNWPLRPRKYGWPTIATITEVVQNGCHVVHGQHRDCRGDKLQWRFSFSFAEIILLQSWTQTQQIVYHLLRFFAKKELIQKDCPKEDEVLCPYHLKTLMLWTCEEMPEEWWNSSSVIVKCCVLLQKLSEWLNKRYCPNYFIPEASLFHDPSSVTKLNKIDKRLKKYSNSQTLCNWFVQNYIMPFIARHFKPKTIMEVMPYLDNYMHALLEFWKVSEFETLDTLFYYTLGHCHRNSRSVMKDGSGSGLRKSLKDEDSIRCFISKTKGDLTNLPTIRNVSCFKYCDNLLYILHTAYGLGCGEISWDSSLFVEFLIGISMKHNTIRSQYHNFPKLNTVHSVRCKSSCTFSEGHDCQSSQRTDSRFQSYASEIQSQDSRFQFLRAHRLMENLTGPTGSSEFQLVSLIAKESLRRALVYDDSQLNDNASATLAYMAALHFGASEYQQAIRLCLAVLSDQTYSMDKETLNAGCLLFIDDVARIVGLCLLYKKIIYNDLDYIGRRHYLDLRLSPYVFAHYLIVLATGGISKHSLLQHELPSAEFPMDEYLKALLRPNCTLSYAPKQNNDRIKDSPTGLSRTSNSVKETVVGLLFEYALENMASFYKVIYRDFGLHGNIVECYRALYLYKCRKYDEVQQLCQRVLHEPDLKNEAKGLTLANILMLPPVDAFFDEDVQSLLGFHTLLYYLSPLREPMLKYMNIEYSTYPYWHSYSIRYREDELCFHLGRDCSIKCKNVLGGHFIARYLKVRCFIDCNLPCKEAMREFAAQEVDRPFELIIRRFLLEKVRVVAQQFQRISHQYTSHVKSPFLEM